MSAQEIADQLAAVVNEARPWLSLLDETVVRHRPTPDRWSIAEVVGHLIDSACNNHQRFIRAQEGEKLTFPKYDQNSWVEKNGYHDSPWSPLVDLWCLYNLHLAQVIRNIPLQQLETECTITPYDACTLGFLVTDYVDHLKHHLAKIRERLDEPAVG